MTWNWLVDPLGQHLAVLQQAGDLGKVEGCRGLGGAELLERPLLRALEDGQSLLGLADAGLEHAKLLPRAVREAGPVVQHVLEAEDESAMVYLRPP